jgi:hypothetical protein
MKPIKIRSLILSALVAGCAVGVALPAPASAQVTADDFNALKKMVEQLSEKVQKLEQTHDQDQKQHEQDLQQIQQLQLRLGETQMIATNAVQKAEAASQVQPVHPVPPGSAGPSATHNFTMVGDAEVQFGKVEGSHGAFALADFAPIFLFRGGDNVLFEAGFDVTLQNNAPNSSGKTTTVDLSFAQLDYLLNDYVTVIGGYMVLPLGTYSERAAGWLNKIPDDPLPRDLLPGSGVGAQLRGAIPIGASGQMVNYSVFGANGPGSADGTGNADALDLDGNVGINSDGSFGNLHSSPSGGGRVGWFYPLKAHYDLELGVSGQSGTWDDAGNHLWSALVLDAALHVSPYFEVKGEYINSWFGTDNRGETHPHGWWLQAGYKLAGLNLDWPYINNLELVGRYDTIKDGLGTHVDRYTVGYVYYLSNTLLFEGDYEFLNSNDPAQSHNAFVIQLSYGF